jgi:hypothetical protein
MKYDIKLCASSFSLVTHPVFSHLVKVIFYAHERGNRHMSLKLFATVRSDVFLEAESELGSVAGRAETLQPSSTQV